MKQKGFTLVELMVVVAILAVLAAILYPNYQQYVYKTGRADGKAKLAEVMSAQERFYSQNQRYTTDLSTNAGLGYGADPIPSNEARYNISAAACAGAAIGNCVVLTATRIGAQAGDAGCGELTLDSRGTRDRTGADPLQSCW